MLEGFCGAKPEKHAYVLVHSLQGIFAAAHICSGVQVVGAWAYDVIGWNNRRAHLVQLSGESKPRLILDDNRAAELAAQEGVRVRPIHLDVDKKAFRYRLWSLRDSQLPYYAVRFGESRKLKQQLSQICVEQRE